VNGMQKHKIGTVLAAVMLLSACNTSAPTPKISTTPVASEPEAPAPSPTATKAATTIASVANDRYQDALNTAAAARAISETALAKDDWSLVADRWQESVHLLKTVPKNSINYPLAMKILPQFQRNLAAARQKSANYQSPKTDQQNSDPTKKVSKADKRDGETSTIVTTTVAQPQSFSLPIIAKNNNVPIVEVVINGSERVPMMLDTGASKTLLTKGVASRLQLTSQGKTKANTANGNAEFDTVKLDSVEFGQGKVTDLSVAVGGDNLNYGLLGHDVYKGYDITLTEDSVQFKKR
jgi:clan AA aspartic protease (TIGR02281 family)